MSTTYNAVSILVLVDVFLQSLIAVTSSTSITCFNPCFSGCLSPVLFNPPCIVNWLGFNPCFSGCLSPVFTDIFQGQFEGLFQSLF